MSETTEKIGRAQLELRHSLARLSPDDLRAALGEIPLSTLAEAMLERLAGDSAARLDQGEVELRILHRDGRFQRGRALLAFGQLRRD